MLCLDTAAPTAGIDRVRYESYADVPWERLMRANRILDRMSAPAEKSPTLCRSTHPAA